MNTIRENRKIIRSYIRLLSVYGGMKGAEKAMKHYIILHNFLGIEELCYDQAMMTNKHINRHLNLTEGVRFVNTLTMLANIYFDPNHKVRFSIETIDDVEEARLYIKENKDSLYDKLIM